MFSASAEPPPAQRAFMAYRSGSPVGAGASAPLVPGHTRAWEDLRKEARKLEGELDVKLAAYAKLCSGFEANYRLKASDSSSLGADQLAQTKATEIESLLQRLSDVNDEMGGFIGGSSDSRSHTLARHRDILQEFNQEFRRLNTTLGAARDRVQLLVGSADSGHIGLNMGTGSGALLRERATIQSSTNAVDEVLLQAQTVSSSLVDQRRTFDSVGDKVLQIGARFPVVNGLLNVIRRKKSKDTLVLSGVIAACTLLIIIYLFAR